MSSIYLQPLPTTLAEQTSYVILVIFVYILTTNVLSFVLFF